MASNLTSTTFRSTLADGTPNALGKVYTYVAGTLTPQATYTTQAGDVPNTNPVTLGADGCAQVWLDSSLTYRVIEKTAALVTIRDVDNITGSALADLASTASGKGAALVGYSSSVTYADGTVGAALQDNAVNIMWFLTQAQRADVKARTLVNDLTSVMQAAHAWANGRPVYYPRGAYKFLALSLSKVGDGIVGDHSGGMLGLEGTLLVSTVSGTTAAIQLTASTAHNVLFKDFTLKQNSTVQGRGIVAADCYWLRTDNLRVTGFTDNLYCSLSIYHHHKRLFSENSTNGVNYWGASGTWNTAWFNNVITFDTCRFSDCTVTGVSIKGCEVVFIAPDFTGMSNVGAIGLKAYGESASFKAHGIKIISPYAEKTKIVFSFLNAKADIDGDGFVQGGVNVGAQAKSIIDADASTVTWSSVEDKDYWEFGYRLTNGSTLRMGALFSGSIRATSGTADATSTFLPDTYTAGAFTITLTGCTSTITGTATWEKRGNTVNLLIPALSGTSNTTAASLTGMPTEIRPATEQFAVANVQNSGAEVIGSLRMFTSGTIGVAAGVFGTAFAAAGVKGIRAGSLVYHVG